MRFGDFEFMRSPSDDGEGGAPDDEEAVLLCSRSWDGGREVYPNMPMRRVLVECGVYGG